MISSERPLLKLIGLSLPEMYYFEYFSLVGFLHQFVINSLSELNFEENYQSVGLIE